MEDLSCNDGLPEIYFDDAAAIAQELHAGQVDKSGSAYFLHVVSVVARLQKRWPEAPKYVVDAAWLHDVLEDTSATPSSLLAVGVPPTTLALVQALTRPRDMPYMSWIGDLAAQGDLWAVRIKLADNADNQDAERMARLPKDSKSLGDRYLKAMRLLENGLVKRMEPQVVPGQNSG